MQRCAGVLTRQASGSRKEAPLSLVDALRARPVERMCGAVLLARTTEATHQHAEVPDVKRQAGAQLDVQSRCAEAPAKGDKL